MDCVGRRDGSSYRAARSAFPAVGLDTTGPCCKSGKTAPEWREMAVESGGLERSMNRGHGTLDRAGQPPQDLGHTARPRIDGSHDRDL